MHAHSFLSPNDPKGAGAQRLQCEHISQGGNGFCDFTAAGTIAQAWNSHVLPVVEKCVVVVADFGDSCSARPQALWSKIPLVRSSCIIDRIGLRRVIMSRAHEKEFDPPAAQVAPHTGMADVVSRLPPGRFCGCR